MTLQRDEPKQPTTRRNKIIWAITLTVAGACLIVAIVIAILDHVRLF